MSTALKAAGQPRVTVLMPVHNAGRYLAGAIESMLGQSYADFELLIVDDASTDGSREVAGGFTDGRVRLLSNDANLGLASTLNVGLAAAHGEYVARMDQDDISLPARLERQVAYLDSHPEVGVLGTGFRVIDSAGTAGAEVLFPASHALIRWNLARYSPLAHPTVMMRRSLLATLGGYRAAAEHCEDYDLWWRASAITRLANLDQVLLQLRKHDANMTVRYASSHNDTAVEVCRAALGAVLHEEFAPDLIAAVMSGVRGNEAHVARAIGLLLRYARHCLSGASPGAEGEAAVRRDLVDQVLRWMDDPAGEVRTLTRLNRIQRHARAACAQALAPDDRRLVRRLAAGRAVEVVRAAAYYRASRLRVALSSAYRAAVPRSARGHFTRIYERNIFGSRESHSGEGSTLEQTAAIRREIPALLRELGAKSLLDAPCGDFNWLREVELGVERYIGVDIVRDLVAADQRRYGRAGREFLCRDLIRDPLPAADVILCRDCLVHLNFRDARQMLLNFRRSGARYLLTTTFTGRGENVDLTGSMLWRTLNLQRAPFNFPAPLRLINENCTEAGGAYADKCLGLWRLEDLS